MIYGSVCSGIEAATVAWHPLGWKAAWFSEIEKFPSLILQHHYPQTPNLGDMTKLYANEAFKEKQIDLLVGGTPCQSFSVAGLRRGLDDPRGNLCLEFLRIVDAKRPRWFVWENVPGVLSSGRGRDFGSFVGAIQKLGYGFAYRILDAQYFGVPQRRRRVFVVGYLGDWRCAAAVLFERESLLGDITSGRKKRKGVAALTSTGVGTCGADDNQAQAGHLIAYGGNNTAGPINKSTACNAHQRLDFESETIIAIQERAICENPLAGPDGMGVREDNKSYTLEARTVPQAVCVHENQRAEVSLNDTMGALKVCGGKPGQGYPAIKSGMQVRRLTPRECERLQGFPDDYTLLPLKKAADGPRYKALGNSMAVPCMRWIGERIQKVEDILNWL